VDLEKMKTWLKGLMLACPFDEETGTCPAAEMRELPLQERLAAVDAMSPETIEQILLFHQSCFRRRTGRKGEFC
jgi:hypothetical protein